MFFDIPKDASHQPAFVCDLLSCWLARSVRPLYDEGIDEWSDESAREREGLDSGE